MVGSIAKAASDNDGSTYRIARVHSSWRILSILMFNDAFAAAAGWTVGLYRTAADGGAAVACGLLHQRAGTHGGQRRRSEISLRHRAARFKDRPAGVAGRWPLG